MLYPTDSRFKTTILVLLILTIISFGIFTRYTAQGTTILKNILFSTAERAQLTPNDVFKKVSPAVVYIESDESAGTGMIIDKDGTILTNYHVIEGYQKVQIKLLDGQMFLGEVIGTNKEKDLALLKIDITNPPTVELGDSENIQQGETLYTLGYSSGLKNDVSIKEGIFSRMVVDGEDKYIESSAEMQPGNSGGPLVDQYGKVIGITTMGLQQEGGGDTLKLSIPINTVKNYINLLKSGGSSEKEEKDIQTTDNPPNNTPPSDFTDSDDDGLSDSDEENIYKTDPLNADTDGDSYSDGYEVDTGFNPKGPGKL